MDVDFKALTPKQEELLRNILRLAAYLEFAAFNRIDDDAVARCGREIGSLLRHFKTISNPPSSGKENK